MSSRWKKDGHSHLVVVTGLPSELSSSGLPSEVVERLVAELGDRGEKVVACLRTAAALIAQAVDDDRGLRLADSAGYNLREALDAVVTGRPPADNGVAALLKAWEQFQLESTQVGGDTAGSFRALGDALRRLSDERDRSSYRAAQLLGYLRDKTGVDPLRGDFDPIREYNRLREDANKAVHVDSALEAMTSLYGRVIEWFIWMFTPPDVVVEGLVKLAAQPWRATEQITELRGLATNPHHLRLFFGRLSDPAWLSSLHDAGLVPPPQPETPWPAAGLLAGLGKTAPAAVAALLQRLLADCKKLEPERRLGARFELLFMATKLGTAGHPVVAAVAALHPKTTAVRALAVGTVKSADPAEHVVTQVAGAILADDPLDRETYHARVLCERLETGLNTDNVERRTRLLAAKVRDMASHDHMRFAPLDIARLTAEPADDHDYAAVITSHFARILSRARGLGVSTSDLLDWTSKIPGPLGERLACRILAEADDIPIQSKIGHISTRLKSTTATGDDRDLVESIMSEDPDLEMLDPWAETLGSPSEAPADPQALLPRDWERAWCWSMVLPEHVLLPWREAIAAVTTRRGLPQPQALDQRAEPFRMVTGRSPYRQEDLSGLAVLEAASKIAAWRPDDISHKQLVSARELARVLEAVVEADPDAWTADPTAVVTTLREPVYVLHYFYALARQSASIASRATQVLDAVQLVRTTRWEPVILGSDDFDFEPNWKHVEAAIVELAAALANRDADLSAHLDDMWTWTLDLVEPTPADTGSTYKDALHRAINTARGKALQAALSLAAWEQRHAGTIRPEFVQLLDDALQVPGGVGMEYRAVLAERRLLLEAVVPTWLETNSTILFRDGDAGRETFDLTIMYSRPTPWFYRHLRDDLFAAARRRTGRAVAWLLVGVLNRVEGYTTSAIIEGLRGDADALATTANEMAFLVQNSSDTAQVATAVDFWQALIAAKRTIVPAKALYSCGRWALVSAVADETWTQLTLETLQITEGAIDLPGEVADRCKNTIAFDDAHKILTILLGKGEPWEQHHVATIALETLRALALRPVGETFQQLRTRLIELGYHDAAQVVPTAEDDVVEVEP